MITATTRDGKFTLAIGAAARVRRDSGIYGGSQSEERQWDIRK